MVGLLGAALRSPIGHTGMFRVSCRQHVTTTLRAVPGVSQTQADLASVRDETIHAPEAVPMELGWAIVVAVSLLMWSGVDHTVPDDG